MMFKERSSGVRILNIGETKRRRLTLPKTVIQNCFAWQAFEGTKIGALGSLYCNYKLVGYWSSYLNVCLLAKVKRMRFNPPIMGVLTPLDHSVNIIRVKSKVGQNSLPKHEFLRGSKDDSNKKL